ncbi:MAG: condensation domain-containing protein [Verrucomicrobiota bacterium]
MSVAVTDDRRERLKQWLSSGKAALHPLTFPQRELWEASPAPFGDPANTIGCLIEIKGAITQTDCLAAMQLVVDRHEVLRLSMLPGKGQSFQMILAESEPAMRFRDVPSSWTLDEVAAAARETFETPFDLVKGPLYRIEVFRRAPNDHVLVAGMHHSISDGWTLGVLVQDLYGAYAQVLLGIKGGLPPSAMSYVAWGAAERAYWQPSVLAQRAAFWKEHLAGSKELFTDRAGHPGESDRLERRIEYIPAELGIAVRDLAKRTGATLYSTLLAAFQIAFSRWTGETDLVVGTPVANRTRQDVRETMGYFAGVVPVRGKVDETRTFSDSLRAVHQTTIDCFANYMPFAELVSALHPLRVPGRNPIYQVRFALQNQPVPDISVAGFSARLKILSTGTPRFDIACEVTEEGDALEVAWLFRKNRFSTAEMDELHRLFLTLLTSVCSSPDSRVSY